MWPCTSTSKVLCLKNIHFKIPHDRRASHLTSPHPSVQLHMYLVIIETKITKSSHFQLSRFLILSDQSWQLFKICHFKKKKKTFLFFLLLPERKHAHELWEDDLIYRFIEKIKLIRFDISLRIPSGLCSCYILVNPNLNFFPRLMLHYLPWYYALLLPALPQRD